MRAAIYFTPPARDALTRAASLWLGRDAFSGEATRAPDAEIDPLVEEPARYGFHATIRAPFRLAEGVDLADVDERLAHFAASRRPFFLKEVAIRSLGPFFALVPTGPSEPLADLEAATLEAFEALRASLTPAEIARRRPEALSDRKRAQLERWGYPHVLDDFRFHMTLTGQVPRERRDGVAEVLAKRFAEVESRPLSVASLALFVEPEAGAPFRVHSFHDFPPERREATLL